MTKRFNPFPEVGTSIQYPDKHVRLEDDWDEDDWDWDDEDDDWEDEEDEDDVWDDGEDDYDEEDWDDEAGSAGLSVADECGGGKLS